MLQGNSILLQNLNCQMDTCCRQHVYVHLALTCMTVLFPLSVPDPDREAGRGAGHPDPEIRGSQVSKKHFFSQFGLFCGQKMK